MMLEQRGYLYWGGNEPQMLPQMIDKKITWMSHRLKYRWIIINLLQLKKLKKIKAYSSRKKKPWKKLWHEIRQNFLESTWKICKKNLKLEFLEVQIFHSKRHCYENAKSRHRRNICKIYVIQRIHIQNVFSEGVSVAIIIIQTTQYFFNGKKFWKGIYQRKYSNYKYTHENNLLLDKC